jgi:hypothetical protein
VESYRILERIDHISLQHNYLYKDIGCHSLHTVHPVYLSGYTGTLKKKESTFIISAIIREMVTNSFNNTPHKRTTVQIWVLRTACQPLKSHIINNIISEATHVCNLGNHNSQHCIHHILFLHSLPCIHTVQLRCNTFRLKIAHYSYTLEQKNRTSSICM